MVERLAELLEVFGGDFARTRCFLHILNLTAKSLLKQFDVKAVQDAEEVDEDVRRLLELAGELKAEEKEAAEHAGGAGVDEGDVVDEDDDDDDSWVDEVASLDEDERAEFEEEVRPVKMTLTKVSHPTTRPERSSPVSHALTDPSAGFQGRQLHYQALASVAYNLEGAGPASETDPS